MTSTAASDCERYTWLKRSCSFLPFSQSLTRFHLSQAWAGFQSSQMTLVLLTKDGVSSYAWTYNNPPVLRTGKRLCHSLSDSCPVAAGDANWFGVPLTQIEGSKTFVDQPGLGHYGQEVCAIHALVTNCCALRRLDRSINQLCRYS